MNSTSHQNNLLPFDFSWSSVIVWVLWSLWSISNGQKRDIQPSKSFAQLSSLDVSTEFKFYFCNKILQARVCIWDSIGKVNFLIFLFEVIFKLQLEEFAIEPISTKSFYPINLIRTCLSPLPFPCHTVGFQSGRIQVFFLAKVAYVKLNVPNLIVIAYFKVIPARMPSSIGITSQK